MIHATIVPRIKKIAYTNLVTTEFRVDGQAAQHKLQAALPKQQANWKIYKKLNETLKLTFKTNFYQKQTQNY